MPSSRRLIACAGPGRYPAGRLSRERGGAHLSTGPLLQRHSRLRRTDKERVYIPCLDNQVFRGNKHCDEYLP